MTFEAFIICMTFAGCMFLAFWALGNVGIDKHKRKPQRIAFKERIRRN